MSGPADAIRTLDPARRGEVEARLLGRTERDVSTGCLVWIGARTKYATFTLPGRVAVGAHRAAYELLVGEIPDGYQVDHLCKNRHCVEPTHLEAVTGWLNNARSDSPTAINLRKTQCIRGHEFTPENTQWTKRGRHCKTCKRLGMRAYRLRKALAEIEEGSP